MYKVAGPWNKLAWMLRTGTEVAWKLGKAASSLWETAWLSSSLSHYWEITMRRYTAFGTEVAQVAEVAEVKAVERACGMQASDRRQLIASAKFYL